MLTTGASRLRIITVITIGIMLAMVAFPLTALAADPTPPPTPPPDGIPPEGMPPEGMPPDGMPPDGMPPDGMPPDGMPPDGMMPPDGGGAGWTTNPDGSSTPPDYFTPPDWWTPPDGWQAGDPLPPGSAPWEQVPGEGTPGSPAPGGDVPGGPGGPAIGDGDGGVPPDDGLWVVGPDGNYIPPDDFTPPDWWIPPEGWTMGDPLPPGTTPWEQRNAAATEGTMPDDGFPGDPGMPGSGMAPSGWLEGDGGWYPPAEFDPPDWWTPPDGWQPGEALPPGTAPWEQWNPGIDGWQQGENGGWIPPDGFTPPEGWVPPEGWQPGDEIPPGAGPWEQWTPADGAIPPMPPTVGPGPAMPPLRGFTQRVPGGWTPGDVAGSWMPPAEFDPPDWWTPPDGWQMGEPLPPGTAPWEQLNAGMVPGSDGTLPPVQPLPVPGAGGQRTPGAWLHTVTDPLFGPEEPLFDNLGNPLIDTQGNQLTGRLLMDQNGEPVLGPDGNPVYLTGQERDFPGFNAPATGAGGFISGGWAPGDVPGSWMPPDEFDPPNWWTPPDGWQRGQALPPGTAPWEQLGMTAPDEILIPDITPLLGGARIGQSAGGVLDPLGVPPEVDPQARTFTNRFFPTATFQLGQPGPAMAPNGEMVQARPVLTPEGEPVIGPFGEPIFVMED